MLNLMTNDMATAASAQGQPFAQEELQAWNPGPDKSFPLACVQSFSAPGGWCWLVHSSPVQESARVDVTPHCCTYIRTTESPVARRLSRGVRGYQVAT